MSGAGLRRKALAATAFGAAGGLSLFVTLALVRWFFLPGGEANAAAEGPQGVDVLWLSLLAAAVLPATVIGWLRGHTFGTAAPIDRRDRWGDLHPDVLRGWAVTVRAYVVGCVLLVAWPDAQDVSALRDGAWASVAWAIARDFVVVVPVGAAFIGPFALILGGAVGWLIGRRTGTATPPVG